MKTGRQCARTDISFGSKATTRGFHNNNNNNHKHKQKQQRQLKQQRQQNAHGGKLCATGYNHLHWKMVFAQKVGVTALLEAFFGFGQQLRSGGRRQIVKVLRGRDLEFALLERVAGDGFQLQITDLSVGAPMVCLWGITSHERGWEV
jgi:hypothetical protein